MRADTNSDVPLTDVRFLLKWPPQIVSEKVYTLGFNGLGGHRYEMQYSTVTGWVTYGSTVEPSAEGMQQRVVSVTETGSDTWRVVDLAAPSVAIPTTQTLGHEFSTYAQTGSTYCWQVSSNLTSWQDLGAPFPGSGVATLSVSNISSGVGFYRLKVLP